MKKIIVIFLSVMSRVGMCFDDYVEEKISNEQRMPSLLYIASPGKEEKKRYFDSKSIINDFYIAACAAWYGLAAHDYRIQKKYADCLPKDYSRKVVPELFRSWRAGCLFSLSLLLCSAWMNSGNGDDHKARFLCQLLQKCKQKEKEISQEQESLRNDDYISPLVRLDRMQCLESSKEENRRRKNKVVELLKNMASERCQSFGLGDPKDVSMAQMLDYVCSQF
jgi:hypothetical protein